VSFPAVAIGTWKIVVEIDGLEPGASYWLSLNGYPKRPCNEELGTLSVPGWPFGQFFRNAQDQEEGYWDFLEIKTDDRGRSSVTREDIPLPPGECFGKFFVKRAYSQDPSSGEVVLFNNSLRFTVKVQDSDRRVAASFGVWLLVALGVVGVGIVLLMRRFRRVPSPPPPRRRIPFKRDGKFWRIGDELYEDRVGFVYLNYILRDSGPNDTKGLNPEQLSALAPQEGAPTTSHADVRAQSEVSRRALEKEELQRETFSHQPELDKRAQQEIRRRLEKIREERREAEELKDVERSDQLTEEAEELEKSLKGADRSINVPRSEAPRKAVEGAIRRALHQIAGKNHTLYDYLTATVQYTSGAWFYRPTESATKIEWDF